MSNIQFTSREDFQDFLAHEGRGYSIAYIDKELGDRDHNDRMLALNSYWAAMGVADGGEPGGNTAIVLKPHAEDLWPDESLFDDPTRI